MTMIAGPPSCSATDKPQNPLDARLRVCNFIPLDSSKPAILRIGSFGVIFNCSCKVRLIKGIYLVNPLKTLVLRDLRRAIARFVK